MVPPSAWTTAVFIAIVLSLGALLMLGAAHGGPTGESTRSRRKWIVGTTIGTVAWLAITGLVSGSGILEANMLPPPAMIFMAISLGLAVALAFSPLGTRLVTGIPVAALVGFQAFRLPLELVLHRWWIEGVLPVQMTFEGHNFDIITGVLAVAVGLWARTSRVPRSVVVGFNVIGLVLLVTVATIAVPLGPAPVAALHERPTRAPPISRSLRLDRPVLCGRRPVRAPAGVPVVESLQWTEAISRMTRSRPGATSFTHRLMAR
jgi:hypothetical protein